MLNIPNNLKFKKYHKIKYKFFRTDNNLFCPKFCNFGIQLKKTGKITNPQIESVRRTIKRFFKKDVYFKTNLYSNNSLTKKPVSSRMGKGKGRHYKWNSVNFKGKIAFEMISLNKKISFWKYKLISKHLNSKLSLNSKLVKSYY